jgi:hypothetical protein
MALSAAKRVRAVLEPANNGLGWVIVRLPFEVEKAWKKMIRLRVKVEIEARPSALRCLAMRYEEATSFW